MKTIDRQGDWILTFSGIEFWPLDPRPEEIDIEDIIVALSRLPRYTGHTRFAYTVGQHSCLVADWLYKQYNSKSLALRGLLHDASEAYTNDITSPLKRLEAFRIFRDIEHNLQNTIYQRFGLDSDSEADRMVKTADKQVFAAEVEKLLKEKHKMKERLTLNGVEKAKVRIKKLSEGQVNLMFMRRFIRYNENR